jgi:hypothetical protein
MGPVGRPPVGCSEFNYLLRLTLKRLGTKIIKQTIGKWFFQGKTYTFREIKQLQTTVSAKKNAHFFKLVTELCQFLGGS